MPQSERSHIIKEFLKWLDAKSKTNGASIQECVNFITLEITEMGATQQRSKSYVESCVKNGLIQIDGLKFRLTSEGKNWLKRKSL